MDIWRATEILKDLADGVDPMTGELLLEDCVCNHPEIVRAFYCILHELEQRRTAPKKTPPENAGKPWSEEDDEVLGRMFDQGCSKQAIQNYFKRTNGSISARLVRIGKISERKEFRKMN